MKKFVRLINGLLICTDGYALAEESIRRWVNPKEHKFFDESMIERQSDDPTLICDVVGAFNKNNGLVVAAGIRNGNANIIIEKNREKGYRTKLGVHNENTILFVLELSEGGEWYLCQN